MRRLRRWPRYWAMWRTEGWRPCGPCATRHGWRWPGGWVAPEDCGGAFPLAAAWVALAELAAGQDGGVERFTAGAVSVQMKGGQDAAARRAVLRLQARQVMRPYIRDEGFVFRGVPG